MHTDVFMYRRTNGGFGLGFIIETESAHCAVFEYRGSGFVPKGLKFKLRKSPRSFLQYPVKSTYFLVIIIRFPQVSC
jgi:hypothetical protein